MTFPDAYLMTCVGRKVDGRAAPGVAAKRCVVLQAVARAVLVHRQPAAVRRRVARPHRSRDVHANCQQLPR